MVETPVCPEIQVRESLDRGKVLLRERCVRYFAGFGSGADYGVHADTVKNLVRGITERVFYVRGGEGLIRPPRPLVGVFKRLGSVRSRLLRKANSTPVVPLDDYPELYNGRKRRVYQAAVSSLKLRGLTKRDAVVSTFIKAEKVNFGVKADPAPRVIQPRSSRYNVGVGQYLKLFEKELFRAFGRVWGYPVVLKGMNAQQVGGMLAQHWATFARPVAVGLDASRFDQHVSREALVWEHSVYNSVFNSPDLARLLNWQLVNRGIARVQGHRVDYRVEGCRMSGDINTGLGNCLLMSSIVIAYCEHAGFAFRLANNGDDCVLFLEACDLPKMAGLDQWFLDFGFTLTREAPVYDLERVEFCQAQPVFCDNGWRMVRNPFTAMSKDCVSLVGWSTEIEFRYWLASVGTCGGALTAGVPVWQSWYARLVALGGVVNTGVDELVRDCGMAYMASGVQPCDVTEATRYSFYKAFGITPDMQCALEAEYALAPSFVWPPTPVMIGTQAIIDQDNPITSYQQHGYARTERCSAQTHQGTHN